MRDYVKESIEIATSRCWIEVDLDALSANIDTARALAARDGRTDRLVILVLKGNAYGLGAVFMARHLYTLGLRMFAVATVPEGVEIKQALPDADVLVMGFATGALCALAIQNGLILTLADARQAQALSVEAMRVNVTARVHIKINTGLNRLGFDPEDGIEQILSAATLPGICAEGIYTHLALHNVKSDHAQMSALRNVCAALAEAGLHFPLVHALDSIGMARHADGLMDGVRIGAWLYGVCPKGYTRREDCRLIASFYARIVQIRQLPKGAYIGYDDEHSLPYAARIATLSVGYGDGYPRLNHSGYVEIRGQRAPVTGIVCMDQMMVDITAIPEAQEGDIATLLGGNISIDEYADFANINRNEALARLSRRVPRLYIQNGRHAALADYFTNCNEVIL